MDRYGVSIFTRRTNLLTMSDFSSFVYPGREILKKRFGGFFYRKAEDAEDAHPTSEPSPSTSFKCVLF